MKHRLPAGTLGASVFGTSLLALSTSLWAEQTPPTSNELDTVTVQEEARGTLSDDSESYTAKTPLTGSTGLPLTVRETPQSVSVISRTKMDDFGQFTVNDALANTTGIEVQRAETDRTYYTSRGFDITNFQFDGLGIPLSYGIARGQQDTAIFERIEVVRGANGLMTGVGNPSAAVNFVRKRPTVDNRASLSLTGGSWDTYRADLDASGALSKNEKIRGRFVGAYQNGDSYLDRYEKEIGVLYGVVEADLTDNTLLTLGYSQQKDKADSPLWGSLPLFYSDGGVTDYNRSTSTSADWAYWDNTRENAFVELQQRFDNGWQAKAAYTYRKLEGESDLFYVYGTPNRDETGLFAYPSLYDNSERQEIYDLNASGPFELGGRIHELIVGVNQAKGEIEEFSSYGFDLGTPLTPDQAFGGSFPHGQYGLATDGSDWTDRYRSAYLATRLSLADSLTLVAGTRYVDVKTEGEGYGTPKTTSANETTPYVGVIVDLNEQHSLYASYTTIFTPQVEEDANGDRLEPIEGNNTELGLKSEWVNGRVNTSLVAFQTEQQNLATIANPAAAPADRFYTGMDIDSHGYEAEIAGALSDGWMLTAGYTWLDIEHVDGQAQKTYIPRDLVRLATSYRPPVLQRKLKVGMAVNWQGSSYREDGPIKTTQDSYAVVNLMAGYDFTDHFNATLRVNNATDESYFTTLRWGQSYYGAPANANLSLNYNF